MIRLADAELRDADVLLYRPGPWLSSWLIAAGGRGRWSHAALAWTPRCHNPPARPRLLIESREWMGLRAVALEGQVRRHPGRIEVFRMPLLSIHQARGACRWLLGQTGREYGWTNMARAALVHLPFVRLVVRPETDDAHFDRRPPFCSQAVAMAYRLGAGVDLVPRLADRLTEPADLARSAFLEYQYTLIP